MLSILNGICNCGCHNSTDPKILHFVDCCNGKCDICDRYVTINMVAHKYCCRTARVFLVAIDDLLKNNKIEANKFVVCEFDNLFKCRDFELIDTILFLAKPDLLGPSITNLFLDLTEKHKGLLYYRGKFTESIQNACC